MLGIVSLAVLALFYLGVYRPTHSPFSGWWTIALLCAAASAVLLLANGTGLQLYANPASTFVSVVGAICVWFATRSLRRRPNPVWLLAVAPTLAVVVACFDQPATNIWAGNGLLFALMAAGFSLGAWEVWGAWALRRAEPDARDSGEAITALAVSGIAATVLGVLYVARFALYMGLGHDHPLFTGAVGSATTSVTLLICLVAVTFSVSAIGWDQRTRALRRRVAEDGVGRGPGRLPPGARGGHPRRRHRRRAAPARAGSGRPRGRLALRRRPHALICHPPRPTRPRRGDPRPPRCPAPAGAEGDWPPCPHPSAPASPCS